MKNIKTYSAAMLAGALLGAGALASCVDDIKVGDGFLEKAPGVDLDVNAIFSKTESAEYFLWNLYNRIHNPHTYGTRLNTTPSESITDLFHDYSGWGGAPAEYYSGSIQPGSGNDKFQFTYAGYRPAMWEAVREGWLIIENIDRVPDMSEEEKSRIKGEAYLILATRYFDGLRNMGGLPLVDHSFTTGDTIDGTRASVEDTAGFIDGLIDKSIAETGFPWRYTDIDTWAGRLTKSGAVALRAKLWLFVASPLFNDADPFMEPVSGTDPLIVWTGGKKQELWQKALVACEAFFTQNQQNGGYYALVQPETQDAAGYAEAFRAAYWYRGNSEKIIEVHHAYKSTPWGWSQGANLDNAAQFGMCNATVEYMEMFGMADGRNYPYKSVANTTNPDNIDIFADRDPRLYETLWVNQPNPREQFGSAGIVQLWEGGNKNNLGPSPAYFFTGLPMRKWVLDLGHGRSNSYPYSYSYIRMADMHLMYAEALAETGNLPKALEEINKVRARVGLGKIETMNPSLNLATDKDNLVDEILRERAVEFGMEDERLYDIIRRKKIDKFTSPLHEMVIWRKTADGAKDTRDDTTLKEGETWPNFIYETRVITTDGRVWWSGGWSNKYLLTPISRDEINKGYGLTQNPGW